MGGRGWPNFFGGCGIHDLPIVMPDLQCGQCDRQFNGPRAGRSLSVHQARWCPGGRGADQTPIPRAPPPPPIPFRPADVTFTAPSGHSPNVTSNVASEDDSSDSTSGSDGDSSDSTSGSDGGSSGSTSGSDGDSDSVSGLDSEGGSVLHT